MAAALGCITFTGSCMKPSHAQFVWFDSSGVGRSLYAYFRRVVTLTAPATEARINIFADSVYQLFVNGALIEFGPVRFDPRFPVYDTIDLAPHLHAGPNVIAVRVNAYGHKTFKSIAGPGGFVAWGVITTTAGETIDLATSDDAWRVRQSRAYDALAPRLSFALNAAEIFHQIDDEIGWMTAAFDDHDWAPAVALERQDYWGPLQPRTIPFMDSRPMTPSHVMHILPLRQPEELYSFSVLFPHRNEIDVDCTDTVLFTTWIHSDEDRDMLVGMFWGDTWLNGQRLPAPVEAPAKCQRQNQHWSLRKGWNHFFGKVTAYHDVVPYYLAFPAGSGVRVSADRDTDSPIAFRHSPMTTEATFSNFMAAQTLPLAPDATLDELGGWVDVPYTQPANHAVMETGWDSFTDPSEHLAADQLDGHVFRHQDYPHGFSLLLDLAYTRLFIPHLRLAGVKDAIVDLTYSEHLMPDGRHLRMQHHVPLGDRVLCAYDTLDWLPCQPRGTRYLMLTVRNMRQDVTLQEFSLRGANYPAPRIGRFTCSDPVLTAVWDMGRRTEQANREDAYDDCVGRERGMYIRDTIIQYHVNLACFGDHALMRRCFELYGQSPDDSGKFRAVYPNVGSYTIADFALNALEGYRAYYEHTGDIGLARDYWPAIQKNLQWFHDLADERTDLLLDADWPAKRNVFANYGGFHGDNSADKSYHAMTGVNCAFSCTYLIALQSAIVLARAMGNDRDARSLARRAGKLTRSLQQFWNPAKGCFSDTLDRATHSAHASLMAVRAGVASRRQIADIRQVLRRDLRSPFINGYDPSNGCYFGPSFSFYLFDGLYLIGLADVAQDLMRQGWGWMLAQGLPTCAEFFSLRASLCHAWSAAPTYYLSKNILGVHYPAAPDLDTIEIKVQAPGIAWAEGAWPHPRGVIEVKWHMDGAQRIFDHIKVPAGVTILQ
jgi:hypothetical protein